LIQISKVEGSNLATIIKCNALLRCNYNMYCNITKISLFKPIAMPLITATTNESDFVAIKRYCHEYDPITILFRHCNIQNFL
jgi:hypothetical protein